MGFATVLDQGPTINVGPETTNWPKQEDPAMIAPYLCKQQVIPFIHEHKYQLVKGTSNWKPSIEIWCVLSIGSASVLVWARVRIEHESWRWIHAEIWLFRSISH